MHRAGLKPQLKMEHIDIMINANLETNLKDGASEIVSRLRPEWGSKTRFIHKTFSDGLTNKLVGVYIEGRKKEMVLVRVYGDNSDLMIDRQKEIQNMHLLYENGCGAKLYATFQNGIAYQFLSGSTLTVDSIRHPSVFPYVAAACAKMHSIKLPKDNVDATKKEACIWKLLRKLQKLSPEGFPNSPEKHTLLKSTIPFTKAELAGEIENMEHLFGEQMLDKTKVDFCHNDLMPYNILISYEDAYRPEVPCISFIDYEYGDWNYREFDIANHFTEFAGLPDEETGEVDFGKCYPSKAFQLKWIEAYLMNVESEGEGEIENPAENEVKELQALVDRFRPLPNLVWGIWSLVQAEHSAIEFDYIGYARHRLEQYKTDSRNIFFYESRK